ncbi:hypothetical protein [Microbacterium sp. NPDC055357]
MSLVTALVLVGCATGQPSEATDTSDAPAPQNSSIEPAAAAKKDVGQTDRVEQADSCDWDSAPLTPPGATAPSDKAGDLQSLIVGAWQHTHYDDGSGFEPVEQDIRFVFPTNTQLLYCQDVTGITDRAENRAAITWEGERMILPGQAPGYIVTEWDADSMVWTNRMDDSSYLLQRR